MEQRRSGLRRDRYKIQGGTLYSADFADYKRTQSLFATRSRDNARLHSGLTAQSSAVKTIRKASVVELGHDESSTAE